MHRTIFSEQTNNIILQQNDMQTKQHICRVDLTFILQDQFSQRKATNYYLTFILAKLCTEGNLKFIVCN